MNTKPRQPMHDATQAICREILAEFAAKLCKDKLYECVEEFWKRQQSADVVPPTMFVQLTHWAIQEYLYNGSGELELRKFIDMKVRALVNDAYSDTIARQQRNSGKE